MVVVLPEVIDTAHTDTPEIPHSISADSMDLIIVMRVSNNKNLHSPKDW